MVNIKKIKEIWMYIKLFIFETLIKINVNLKNIIKNN